MTHQKRVQILVIDDTPNNIKYMQEVLHKEQYDVRVAPNGKRGLKAATTEPPDLILLDIMMPDINGYDVCTQLKANEATCEIPVIFLSAIDETWDKVRAFQCGGVDYVTKPFEPVELLQRIKAQLQLRVVHQELAALNQDLQHHLDIIDQYVMTLNLDTEGTITHASKAFYEATGYSKGTLVGKMYEEICHPECSRPICKSLLQTIQNKKTREKEIPIQKVDGSTMWVHIDISPQRGDTGEVIGYTTFQHDITDKQKLELLAITDELTNLYNRREFNASFPRELGRARRDDKYFALLFVDVDFFKNYNDTYGHQEGDKVLQLLAQTMKKSFLRVSDLIFRIGGEEFAVILTSNSEQPFITLAERFCKNLEALAIPHAKNAASKFVTASVGIKITPASDRETPEAIYHAADEALYKAKKQGRNQVVVSGADSATSSKSQVSHS